MTIPPAICRMLLRSVAGVLAAVAAVGVLAGCGATTTAQPVTTPPPAASPAPGPQHNQADVVFAQHVIPLDAQTISMAELAPRRAGSSQVKGLASRISVAEDSQIQQLRGLLIAWGAAVPATTSSGDMAGLGHGQLPGMMSYQQMARLSAATGAAFDRMFLQMMIAHHQGAVETAQTELAQGNNPAARQLAQQVSAARQAEITEMQTLLQRM